MSSELRTQLDQARQTYMDRRYTGDLAADVMGDLTSDLDAPRRSRPVVRVAWWAGLGLGAAAAVALVVLLAQPSTPSFDDPQIVGRPDFNNTTQANRDRPALSSRSTLPTVQFTPPDRPASLRDRIASPPRPDLSAIAQQITRPRLRWTLRRPAPTPEPPSSTDPGAFKDAVVPSPLATPNPQETLL